MAVLDYRNSFILKSDQTKDNAECIFLAHRLPTLDDNLSKNNREDKKKNKNRKQQFQIDNNFVPNIL